MRKSIKRVARTGVSATLVVGLVLCNSTFIEAKKVSKQESVYVTAGADGSTTEITVSDWLKDSGIMSGTISDSSNLTDIVNVKGEEEFSQSGEAVEWNTSDNDIYYQGKSSEELPVNVSITYSLDGEEMSAEDMVGKSGEMKMHVTYTNQSKQKKKINGKEVEIYTPFVMVTGMILSSDNFTNIEIDHGRVINDGSNNVVVGLGVPGLAESLDLSDDYSDDIPSDFTVTADVTDFSMGNTFTFASSNLLNDVDLEDSKDLDDLEDKLDELTDAAAKLVDGTDTLSDSMSLFHDKMDELKKSAKTYNNDGVKKITNGIGTLAKSGKKLVSGVNEYADGVTSLSKGAKSYVAGADKIAQGNTKLYEAVKGLPDQLNTFDSGLTAYTGAVDKMGTEENVTKLKNGTKAVSDGISTINQSVTTLESSFTYDDQVVSGLKEVADNLKQLEDVYTVAGDTKSAAGYEQLRKSIETAYTSLETVTKQQKAGVQKLKEATSDTSDLKTGADAVSSGVSTVMDGLSTLSGKSSALTDASGKLKSSTKTLVSSVKQLKEGGDTLTKNDKALTSGANKLTKASKKMKKSAKKLNSGMQSLNKGATSLETATLKLLNGIDKLDTASGKLEKGATKLNDGMVEFNDEGIKKINKTYQNDVKTAIDRLNAVLDAGKEYKNFSGIGDSMDGEVKFIIETAPVSND